MLMEETLYQVIITGRVLGAVSPHHAISAFANLFSISPEQAQTRFTAAPCVVRSRLSAGQAEKYCKVMRRLGIESDYEQEEPGAKSVSVYPRLSPLW